MSMRTRVELIGKPGSTGRLRETAEILLAFTNCGGDLPLSFDAPRWLAGRLHTLQEAEAWLARWRAAPDKPAFERDSGWLYWFSSANDSWELHDVSIDAPGSRIIVSLGHDDDPIPLEALRWLAVVADLEVGDEFRVD